MRPYVYAAVYAGMAMNSQSGTTDRPENEIVAHLSKSISNADVRDSEQLFYARSAAAGLIWMMERLRDWQKGRAKENR